MFSVEHSFHLKKKRGALGIKLKIKGALGIYLEAKGAPGRKSLGNTALIQLFGLISTQISSTKSSFKHKSGRILQFNVVFKYMPIPPLLENLMNENDNFQ